MILPVTPSSGATEAVEWAELPDHKVLPLFDEIAKGRDKYANALKQFSVEGTALVHLKASRPQSELGGLNIGDPGDRVVVEQDLAAEFQSDVGGVRRYFAWKSVSSTHRTPISERLDVIQSPAFRSIIRPDGFWLVDDGRKQKASRPEFLHERFHPSVATPMFFLRRVFSPEDWPAEDSDDSFESWIERMRGNYLALDNSMDGRITVRCNGAEGSSRKYSLVVKEGTDIAPIAIGEYQFAGLPYFSPISFRRRTSSAEVLLNSREWEYSNTEGIPFPTAIKAFDTVGESTNVAIEIKVDSVRLNSHRLADDMFELSSIGIKPATPFYDHELEQLQQYVSSEDADDPPQGNVQDKDQTRRSTTRWFLFLSNALVMAVVLGLLRSRRRGPT